MNSNSHYDLFDLNEDLESYLEVPDIRNMPCLKAPKPAKKARAEDKAAIQKSQIEIAVQDENQDSFNFSYHASRHERIWLANSLNDFHDGQWFEDVLRLVKGGKEASVYLCKTVPSGPAGYEHLAAKVYRPRQFRNLRKDHLYREGRGDLDIEGRTVLDDRMLRAMHKRTSYGQELLHTSWIGHEYATMQILHAAGVDLPTPLASGNNAILMDYIGDPDLPAPTLNTVELDPDEALALFDRVLWNIERMLANRRIHGDLSAFNVLYWEGRITLIDFPQAIDPEENRNAFRIFERDVTRICEYFTRQGVPSNPSQIARELWSAHGYRQQPEVHPSLLDDQDERDRSYWQSMQPD